jgi:hypothetical protein
MTAFPSLNEIERHVVLAIEKSTFTWPPVRLLLMLPNKETEKLVSCRFIRQVLHKTWLLLSGVGLLGGLC